MTSTKSSNLHVKPWTCGVRFLGEAMLLPNMEFTLVPTVVRQHSRPTCYLSE